MPPLCRHPRRPQRADALGRPELPLPGVRAAVRGRPRTGPVSADDRGLVERLLAERVGLRAIARATGRSRSWVQRFANALYRERTPHHPGPLEKKGAI